MHPLVRATHYQAPHRRPQSPPCVRRHPRPATSKSRRHPSYAPLQGLRLPATPSRRVVPRNQIASATKRCGAGPEGAARGEPCHAPPQMVARPTCAGVRLCAPSSAPSQCTLMPAAGCYYVAVRSVMAGASVALPQATSSYRRLTDARAQVDAGMAAGPFSCLKGGGRRREET
ncbi:hypothetical protein BJ912DRAFT_174814 [Pholiota molesta]|nr:hypothetical protein BJ912DRAFT_174814 [Pholiota molesta]